MSNDTTMRKSDWYAYELPHGEEEYVWHDLGTIELRQAKRDLSQLRHALASWTLSARACSVTVGTQSQTVVRLREELAKSEARNAELKERLEFYRDLANKRDESLAELDSRIDGLRRAIESLAMGGS